jgi:ankyrin repeat protein
MFSGVDTSISIDDNKQTALHVASFSGNYKLVESLLKNEGKVNVNARDEHNWTGNIL